MTTDQETFHLASPTSHITVHDKPREENDMTPTLKGPNVAPPVNAQQSSIRRILPHDFYSSAQVNQGACFREAIQVIQDDRIIDPIPKGTQEIDWINQLSRKVVGWASGWDGVAHWPVTLDYSFAGAVEED